MPDQGPAASKRSNPNAPARVGEREAITRAMLGLSGEFGYRAATIGAVAARAGVPPARFYSYFGNRGECFELAYKEQTEPVLATMLAVARRAGSWREGLRAALTELFGYVVARPVVSRALLAEVYVAGGGARARHEEVLERLSRAVDGTCRETAESRHSPPPLTATFMVGAIEESVRWHLADGEVDALWQTLPELMYLITGAYLGDAVALEERRRPAPADER